MKTIRSFIRNRVSSTALSAALLICSAVWFASAWYTMSASNGHTSTTPLFLILIQMVTPAICFALGVDLTNSHPQSLSRLDSCALLAALFPITLGSILAIWEVKVWFWAGFQEASVMLKSFGAFASLALIVISCAMIWKTVRTFLSGKSSHPPKTA